MRRQRLLGRRGAVHNLGIGLRASPAVAALAALSGLAPAVDGAALDSRMPSRLLKKALATGIAV
jgi:hypothetical protein